MIYQSTITIEIPLNVTIGGNKIQVGTTKESYIVYIRANSLWRAHHELNLIAENNNVSFMEITKLDKYEYIDTSLYEGGLTNLYLITYEDTRCSPSLIAIDNLDLSKEKQLAAKLCGKFESLTLFTERCLIINATE